MEQGFLQSKSSPTATQERGQHLQEEMTASLFLTIIVKTPNYEKGTTGDLSAAACPELEVQYQPRVLLSSHPRYPPPTFRHWHDHHS